MTIIVYRDGVMASDSWTTSSGKVIGTARKLVRSPSGTIGGAAGTRLACEQFRAWVAAGYEGPFALTCKDDEFSGLLVRPDGRVFDYWHDGHCEAPENPWHATGETVAVAIATGALAAGADAQTAVRIVCERSVWCGGNIQVERL